MQTGFVYYIYYIHLVCLIIPPTARKTLLTKSEMQMLLKDANWFRLLYLLYPLSVSDYTTNSTQDFVNKIRDANVTQGCKLVSFTISTIST